MRIAFSTAILGALFYLTSLLHASDTSLDILIIGSTHSYSEGGESGISHEAPFDPTSIAPHLESILDGDAAVSETANVVFEDLYRNQVVSVGFGGGGSLVNFTQHCYSLTQYFMWPNGRDARLQNLRGESGTAWDYVIIIEDPFVLANFPGMYAEAVRLYQEEVAKGTAELVLMSQWPETGSNFTANAFNELAFRSGDSLSLQVVPAAKAWDTLTPKDSSSSHPTPDGAYLAAAAIYSKLLNRNASTSSYRYDDTLANHALTSVQAANGVAQYSGKYTIPNKFQMKYVQKRQIDFNEYGTSTEEGFFRGLRDAIEATNMSYSRRNPSNGNPVDISYSRGNDAFEANKQYRVDPALFHRTYGFPMGDHGNTGVTSMKYGIDKRYYFSSFYDGTDLGIVYNMIREGNVEPTYDVRGIPVRLLWSKLSHYVPDFPAYRDSWHLSDGLDRAAGAFMFTLNTGRCPIGDEPADNTSNTWQRWYGLKIGYETAWQMAHMTSRVPGFRVTPASAGASDVAPNSSENLSVKFLYPPTSNVTVNLSVDDPDIGVVSPSSLTFTPGDYETPKTVVVSGAEGSTGTFPFNVTLTTTSTDEVFNGLFDQWEFDNTRMATRWSLTYLGNNPDSGSAPDDPGSPYEFDTSVTVLGNISGMTKSGFKFDGWNTNSDGSGTDYSASETFTITADTTLHAQWTPITGNYSVPHAWLNGINSAWSSDYEAAVLGDQDGDGIATWLEYWNGTDPEDSNSYPGLEAITVNGSTVELEWSHAHVDPDIPDMVIERSPDESPESWSQVGAKTPTNGLNTWSETLPYERAFYRLAAPVLP